MLQIYMRRKNTFRKPIPITLWQTHSWEKEIVIRVPNCPDARKGGRIVRHAKGFRYLKRECKGFETAPAATEPRAYFSFFSRSGAATTHLKQKLTNSALCSWLLAGALAFCTASLASAQTPPSLGLHLFAGVNVAGVTGSVYAVQSTSNLAESNSWTSLAFVQLTSTNYLFVDTTAPVVGNRFYRALLQTPPTNMVFIPPNTFRLGSPTNEIGRSTDEGPQTDVAITHGFWMGKFEVTQREYVAVIGSNPSGFTGDLNRPVERVSWLDATNYCAKLTQQELAAGRIPPGGHYRLPTEAEWEYAARAGTSTRFSYGDDPTMNGLTNYAWYAVNSGNMTHPVGQKLPNPWGLYDMAGNVLEWCLDWYGPYPGGFETDPQGPASNSIGVKVIRGGAWDGFETDCRSARRQTEGVSPFMTDFILGFRIVLAAP